MLKVLVADSHDLLREGLRSIIDRQADMTTVGEASDARQALRLCSELRPDLTILGSDVLFSEGPQAAASICGYFRRGRLIVLLEPAAGDLVNRALRAGAQSLLLKSASQAQVVEAIRSVFRGRRHIPPSLAGRLAESVAGTALTARELQVLQLVSGGKSNKRIAAALGIEEGTVKVHLKNILGKLGASDRTQAVTTALKLGIIQLD